MRDFVLDARTATPHFPGIGRYVTSLARALAPLLAPDERLTLLCDSAHPPVWAPRLVPVSSSPFSLRQQWSIPRLLRRLAVVDSPSQGRGPVPSAIYHSAYYLMPYRPGVPTILTAYDLIPILFPRQSTARSRLMFRWTMALALRTAEVVLAISEATRRDLLAHFRVAPERVLVVPLGADPSFAPGTYRAQGLVDRGQPPDPGHRSPAADPYVLYVGSNKPHKNLVRLVEAWGLARRQSPNSSRRLVLAGSWDARYGEAQRRAAELGLAGEIIFLGPVAEADLPALYAGAMLFVFPSLYEGFGLPVLEAMAAGTPVICSNTSSLPEVAGDAALLVNPLEAEALADAIVGALADDALRADLRRRGLDRARRFSWERTAQETLTVYRQVAEGSG